MVHDCAHTIVSECFEQCNERLLQQPSKMQSSAKHCTSVNYCWKLFWSQLNSYILVWLHRLGLHTLISFFFLLMQSLERCDPMPRKSKDDNVWERILRCRPLFFLLCAQSVSTQIFSHKSTITVLCALAKTPRSNVVEQKCSTYWTPNYTDFCYTKSNESQCTFWAIHWMNRFYKFCMQTPIFHVRVLPRNFLLGKLIGWRRFFTSRFIVCSVGRSW